MIRALPASILASSLMGFSASDGRPSMPPHQVAAESGTDVAPADATFEQVQETASGNVLAETSGEPDTRADAPVPGADCSRTVERHFACRTFVAVHDFRVSQGLQALVCDPKIVEAAEWDAQYMAEAGTLEHGLDG